MVQLNFQPLQATGPTPTHTVTLHSISQTDGQTDDSTLLIADHYCVWTYRA